MVGLDRGSRHPLGLVRMAIEVVAHRLRSEDLSRRNTSIRRRLVRMAGRFYLRNRLLLVTDNADWIIDHVAENLRASVPQELRSTVVNRELRDARNCVVHFISRDWAWFDGTLDAIHPSNRIIGLWWHGRLDSLEPDIRAALDRARELRSRFDRMQVTCTSGKETMLALGVPEGKIVVLPEGIDLKRFPPLRSSSDREQMRGELGVPHDRIVIGCFQKDGQGWGDGFEPKLIKGPDVLADTLERLHRRYPIFALIPGPSRGYLKRRLDQAGVPYSAPGFVPADSLPRYYHALDIYLSPSRDEGGPAGVLESMASGIPVVSTRAGMPADMIGNGVNGFLAGIEDVDGLVEGVVQLIERPDLRWRIAEQGLRAIRAYDWSVLGRRYAEELYRPLLNGRG